jgi:thiamine-phosphate pyrophosphorylase
MARCHPLPHRWLFTDARLGDHGLRAARRMAVGSGIVVRSHDLSRVARDKLIRGLRVVAKARQHKLFIAAEEPAMVRRHGAAGLHLRSRNSRLAAQARRIGLAVSMPVHSVQEAEAARRARADYVFVSPLFPTRSHPGAPVLKRRSWAALVRRAGAQAAALGGMTAKQHRVLLRQMMGHRILPGWAAIDAWL